MMRCLAILALAATVGFSAPTRAADWWWAMSIYGGYGDEEGNGYAAAWGYKTEQGAVDRVRRECGGSQDCLEIINRGNNGCLLIMKNPMGKPGAPKLGDWYSYSYGQRTAEEARTEFRGHQRRLSQPDMVIHLLKCPRGNRPN